MFLFKQVELLLGSDFGVQSSTVSDSSRNPVAPELRRRSTAARAPRQDLCAQWRRLRCARREPPTRISIGLTAAGTSPTARVTSLVQLPQGDAVSAPVVGQVGVGGSVHGRGPQKPRESSRAHRPRAPRNPAAAGWVVAMHDLSARATSRADVTQAPRLPGRRARSPSIRPRYVWWWLSPGVTDQTASTARGQLQQGNRNLLLDFWIQSCAKKLYVYTGMNLFIPNVGKWEWHAKKATWFYRINTQIYM